MGVCEVGRTTDNIRNVGCILNGREGWEGGVRGGRVGRGERRRYTPVGRFSNCKMIVVQNAHT